MGIPLVEGKALSKLGTLEINTLTSPRKIPTIAYVLLREKLLFAMIIPGSLKSLHN
jgi:hypothetical protein